LIPECLNSGGTRSLLRLANPPSDLETAVAAAVATLPALAAWQARPGEVYSVVDSAGSWFRARLQVFNSSEALFIPFERIQGNPEGGLPISVFQALPDKERFELVLEKLTELGVSRLVPFQSERSVSLAELDARQKKSHRWPDLVVRAAKQCRRGMLPELLPVLTREQALSLAAQADLKLLLYEGHAEWQLGAVLTEKPPSSVSLLIGPEGGFTREEIEAARKLGILTVSVGPRTLRTETAAIAAAVILQHRFGDLG